MTFFLLVIAVLFEGEIHVFHYGSDKPFAFPTLETCEAKLVQEQPRIPSLLKDGAKLLAMRCLKQEKPLV